MTSPIDLLTRLKAQLEKLDASTAWCREHNTGVHAETLHARLADLLVLLTACEEAIRQDHPPLSERPEPLKALYRQVDFGVPPSITWLNERARELEAIFAASEQRVQALEAELSGRNHECELIRTHLRGWQEVADQRWNTIVKLEAELAALRAPRQNAPT